MAKVKNRASDDALGDLHQAFAGVMKQWLTHTYTDQDGNPIPPPQHVLTNIRGFLKDNEIKIVEEESDALQELKQAYMPFNNVVDIKKVG